METNQSQGLLQQLHPADGGPAAVPLHGLYRDAVLPEGSHGAPWVYGNFIVSLDGRISLDAGGGCRVPGALTNPADWRLLQELAVHADCLVTSGRYLRELAAGCAQDTLPLGPGFEDLQRRREELGKPRQPDIAVISRSLDVQLPEQWRREGRRIWLLAGSGAPEHRLAQHQRAGAGVALTAEGGDVTGRELRSALAGIGYRRVYTLAGPQVAHTLMRDGSLDAQFLTVRHRVLGGSPGTFETLAEGPALGAPADFELTWLYLDTSGAKPGQHFMRLDRIDGRS